MFSPSSLGNTTSHIHQKGFGLIELMVSISLIVLVMGIVLVNHNSFNGAVLLRSQAYEIALQVREVQLNAVSVARSGDTFRAVYGVHFDTDTTNNRNQRYAIFRDTNANYYYNSGEAFGIQGSVDGQFEIRAIRTISGGVSTNRTNISIVFERPNFDARFFTAAAPGGQVNAEIVEIDIARREVSGTGNGVVRTVEITSAGQISIKEN